MLVLKDQREPDPETNEPFPYNRVKVIGPSPINHGIASGEWTGTEGDGVIITPLSNFGGTLDEPFGKLRALYEVESVPEHEGDVTPKVRVINATTAAAGPTPEEVFAEKAPGKAPEPGQIRARTPRSPLEDPRPKATDGPLGPAPTVDTGVPVIRES